MTGTRERRSEVGAEERPNGNGGDRPTGTGLPSLGVLMVRVVARVPARTGHAEVLRHILVGLLAPTRAERGCLFYDVHLSDDPEVFTFIEAWASEADLEVHLASAHIQQALLDIAPHVAAPPEIRRYRPIEA